MRAWLFQDPKRKKLLAGDAPWCVGYYDPDGKRKQITVGSKSMAEKRLRKIEGELAAGVYADTSKATWEKFRDEYDAKVLAGMSFGNRSATETVLRTFERLAKPNKMRNITTRTIDGFVADRKAGKVRGDKAPSPATINRDLRHLRAVLRKATKWGYLPKCPEFTFLREHGRVPCYVPPEHFVAIYKAAGTATLPEGQPYASVDWWRALLVVAYMTGWRIGSIMSLRWADVDLEAGTALSRAENNKGRRDQLLPLHALVIEHLGRIKSFEPCVFVWVHDGKRLYEQFGIIQTTAAMKPAHGKARYGFHDFRRAFATLNAEKLTGDTLQALMQHKSYTTTQKYINMSKQVNQSVAALFVPDVSTHGATG